MIRCPACGHINTRVESLLGKLGCLTHYRCRYCGMTFHGRN
jgi:transposase-like protein